MSGGFENSAMKRSFSLSSLPSNMGCPDHAALYDKPYSTLGKKSRNERDVDMSWRTWCNAKKSKDEFWAALKNNYQYLMDTNLIESCCREAGSRQDILVTYGVGGSPLHEWSIEQFKQQFSELDLLLNSIHDALRKSEDDSTDQNLRLNQMEEMLRKLYKRKVFNHQGSRIVARFPELKEEIAWRVAFLNSKWEQLEKAVTSGKRINIDSHDGSIDIDCELRCFRRWIKQTDRRIPSIDFQRKWTTSEIGEKAKELEVLKRDVESHGKIIRKLVKVCERFTTVDSEVEGVTVTSFSQGRRLQAIQAVRFAQNLENSWQLLYLRLLEWLCHINEVTKRLQNSSLQRGKSQDSDYEPVLKVPRLSNQHTLRWSQQTQHPNDINAEVSLMDCGDESKMVGSDVKNEISKVTNSEVNGLELLNDSTKCSSGDNLSEKMKTEPLRHRRQSVPIDCSDKLFNDHASEFTQSKRIGPLCEVTYFRHKDTDSEQDITTASDKIGKKGVEESSDDDEEWLFTSGADNNNTEQEADSNTYNNGSSSEAGSGTRTIESQIPRKKEQHQETENSKPDKKEELKRLINQAEELVREDVTNSPARKTPNSLYIDPLRFSDPPISKGKYTRVKEWLNVQGREPDDTKAVVDSCDASCECTTEDDDLEQHSSDDLNTSSVATCHHSAEVIESTDLDATLVSEKTFNLPLSSHTTPEHTKVIMRQKRNSQQIRPWSVTEISQIGNSPSSHLSQFSISESALHQLTKSSSQCKMESSVHGTLSSSTVEETTVQAQEGSGGGYSSNSLRRRKVKLRKRNLGRKSESGSEGVLAMDPGSPLKNGPRRPPNSGTETEEETEEGNKLRAARRKLIAVPAFRLGPTHGAVTTFTTEKVVSAESSFSEQAWDNYQEKYMSEAYSEEAADPEAARRLLEFGDDYRNFFDSQSDCASNFSRPRNRRRHTVAGDNSLHDSDSDFEDVRNLIRQSNSHYQYSEKFFALHLSKSSPQLILASDFADLITRCKENIHCLTTFLQNFEGPNNVLPTQLCQDIKSLVERWEVLEEQTENLQRMRTLQREMSAFKDELLELSNRVGELSSDLDDQDQLRKRIQEIKSEVAGLRELKSQLSQVNYAIHRFLTDTGHTDTALKEDVADLYKIWGETNQRTNQQLNSLQQLSTAWQQFELNLSELQVALRGDHETLRMLDSALQGGSVTPNVATSVRNVAKVLSEKQEICCESAMDSTEPTTDLITATQIVGRTDGSGSISDSGISDSGSEQDLSEREKRLAALRKSARTLKAILAPGSQAINDMDMRIQQTELDLRELQQTCRDLIVKTAVCAEAKVARKSSPVDIDVQCDVPSPPSSRQLILQARRKKGNLRRDILPGIPRTGASPDDPNPDNPHSFLWRVMRAALPFQIAIMGLLCIGYLLEPSCCENLNNWSYAFTPQLRYLNGPPPV